MAAVAESADLPLDACAALREDFAARAGAALGATGAAPNTPLPAIVDALPEGAAAGDARRAAAWLPLVIGLEGAARLVPRDRPAHFRRQRPAWEAAADVFGETRYARVGNRLARWRASDPRLSVVKELLWALEQPEAAGYTRLALAGMTALGKLVPISDLRYGYVAVQSARAVRTLGNSQGAVERYAVGERLGHRYRDRWLCARSATGLGATYLYLGNYPAARAVFHSVVAEKLPDASLTATAHHGLLISAMAAQNWDAAIAQGWHLLQAGKAGAVARTDVLNLMANLCQRIGRYRAAIRAAESALQLAVRADQVVASLAVLVDVATVTSNRELGRQYGPLLRKHVRGSAGPYEDARALLALAGLEYMCGTRDAAYADLASARVIADRLGYHELQFEVEKLSAAFSRNSDTSAEMGSAQTSPAVDVLLSQPSRYIMSKLDNWGEHDIPNAAVAFQ